MITKIKSKVVIKLIFKNIELNIKLKLIKKNKNLQKINNISIYHYKYFSNSYIIYDAKTKGKEYDSYNNKLLFEVEYLNGERNGQGKEYCEEDIMKFEGEYLKGIKNGKGKEYYLSGEILFEGEYRNGKKWNGKGYNLNKNQIYEIKDGKGLIKEYDKECEGALIFEGEYLNGERNGKGKEYNYLGDIIFEGEYLNGKRNGHGKEYESKKLKFEG